MRGMLILGLLVGMVGTAWAGKPLEMDIDIIDIESTSVVVVDKKVLAELLAEARRDGASLNVAVYEYDGKREVWDRARPAPCLETMQAAMEAMEPFTPWRQATNGNQTKGLYDATVLWTEAKQCWGKP